MCMYVVTVAIATENRQTIQEAAAYIFSSESSLYGSSAAVLDS